jgi:hypothetical protein
MRALLVVSVMVAACVAPFVGLSGYATGNALHATLDGGSRADRCVDNFGVTGLNCSHDRGDKCPF